MQQLGGSRDGTAKYLYKNFLFHVDTNYRGRRYLCAQRQSVEYQCPVSAIVEDDIVYLSGAHNHPTATLHLKEPARNLLKELAINDLLASPHDLINTVYER